MPRLLKHSHRHTLTSAHRMASSVVFTHDVEETHRAMVWLLRNARKAVVYSVFICDLDNTFTGFDGLTLGALLHETCARGVHVTMLYNPSTSYGNLPLNLFRKKLPKRNFTLHTCEGSGSIFPMFKYLNAHSTFSYHHQKFLASDAHKGWALVTGSDFDTDRKPWLQMNSNNYFWHEFGVLTPLNTRMRKFLYKQVNRIRSPCLPFVNGEREHSLWRYLIRNARSYLHIEHQMIISTDTTHNKVAYELVHRIGRAVREGDQDFRVIMLVNYMHPDEGNLFNTYLRMCLMWSKKRMERLAEKMGIQDSLYDHLRLGYLQHEDVAIKIHSNVLIQDGEKCLRSSSNLSDRSLSKRPADTELGIVVTDARSIARLQQNLWNKYLNTSGVQYTAVQVGDALRKQEGCLRDGNVTQIEIDVMSIPFLLQFLNENKVFGGKEHIYWKVKKVQ